MTAASLAVGRKRDNAKRRECLFVRVKQDFVGYAIPSSVLCTARQATDNYLYVQ